MPESTKRGKLHPSASEHSSDPSGFQAQGRGDRGTQSLGFRAFAAKHYDLITRQKQELEGHDRG